MISSCSSFIFTASNGAGCLGICLPCTGQAATTPTRHHKPHRSLPMEPGMRMAGARHWVLVGLSPAVLTLIHQSAACCRTSSRRRALRDDEGRVQLWRSFTSLAMPALPAPKRLQRGSWDEARCNLARTAFYRG